MYYFVKMQVTFQDFIQAFQELGLQETYSMEGMEALFNFLNCQDIEFDVCKICSEWTEYWNITAMLEDYPNMDQDQEDVLARAMKVSTVLPLPGQGFMVKDF